VRASSALVAIDTPPTPPRPSAEEAFRTLVELIEIVSEGTVDASNGDSSQPSETVLVDTEVHGHRYLLVRMPNPGRNRVQLSPREQEIVRMVAKGHPNKVIADVLNISSWTVCTHLRRIFAKLGVGSRAAMVAQLLQLGVLGSEHRGRAGAR
jgi:DNA-binding CsgD family transcriptional regulator